jgi:hypothetical protein
MITFSGSSVNPDALVFSSMRAVSPSYHPNCDLSDSVVVFSIRDATSPLPGKLQPLGQALGLST